MKKLIDYDVTCLVMGGGAGTRLAPLTRDRAKPAVPLGGKFRLIDIPISNCINSGIPRIYILTQFNSASLNNHIGRSYHFDRFTRGFVQVLAAQQTPRFSADASWYQGTADAVRKNLHRLEESGAREVLILSGDQIYRVDFQEVLATHRGRDGQPRAGVTIGAVLVGRERARGLGVLRTDRRGRVEAFVEKPREDDEKFRALEASHDLLARFGHAEDGPEEPTYLANMGIYIFDLDVLTEALDNDATDFGGEVLPAMLEKTLVRAHLFRGYWEDIGTIRAFHRANLDLARKDSPFDFYAETNPIYTRARLLPGSRLTDVAVKQSLICDGCLVEGARIEDSIIGLRSTIGRGAEIHSTYVMGADWYETGEDRSRNRERGVPDVGIGEDCVIRNAIIDKDARLGRGVRITNEKGRREYKDGFVIVRDGIAIVPRGGFVPDGYEI